MRRPNDATRWRAPRQRSCPARYRRSHPRLTRARYDLLECVWDYDYEQRSNVVAVYVRYLREKIDRPFGRHTIETLRGAGYRLRGAP